MCDEEMDLRRRVCEDFRDDTPRVVLADWLDDCGRHPEATVIRSGCARPIVHRYDRGWPAKLRHLPGLKFTLDMKPQDRPMIDIGFTFEVAPAMPEVAWEVSRGMVSGVHLATADFIGRRCPNCDGVGHTCLEHDCEPGDDLWAYYVCSQCDGEKYVGGLARQLFASHPVERVVLTDREPWVSIVASSWFDAERVDGDIHPQSDLPGPIFALLDGHDPDTDPEARHYPDGAVSAHAELARDALELRAAVNYGRALVGLPAV
jgi:uncharacterized protein (TIGR02996 family)